MVISGDRENILGGLRAALRDRPDVYVALLFSSFARGTAQSDSDVDVAILAPGVDGLTLRAQLTEKVGREVDVAPLETAGVPLLENVLRDGIVVHEGRAGAGAMFRSHALATLETDRSWFVRMRDSWLQRVAERGIGW